MPWATVTRPASANQPPLVVYARGYAWSEGICYHDGDLAECLADYWSSKTETALTETEITRWLVSLDGFFGFAVILGSTIIAGVDRLRSIPLFYTLVNHQLVISDLASELAILTGSRSLDAQSTAEFLLARYVTGPETLISNIHQIQAGEFILTRPAQPGEVLRRRYFAYLHDDGEEFDEHELGGNFQQSLTAIFDRLVRSVGGGRLVIPLSGGYDSRLIAVMLKEMGYENVLCFTYGQPDNWEVTYSRQIARKLGYRWIHVPYSYQRWRQESTNPEIGDYLLWAGGLSSLPHLQDWLAVRQLVERQEVGANDFIVPGHTGDFISGGHLKAKYASLASNDLPALAGAIFSRHYHLWNIHPAKYGVKDQLVSKIEKTLAEFSDDQRDPGSRLECWEWQERQAKFIVNSVRVYEYWGCQWRMPLWDAQFIHFWRKVPFSLRLNQCFYKKELVKLFRKYQLDHLTSRDFHKVNPLLRYLTEIAYRPLDLYMGRYSLHECLEAWKLYRNTFGLYSFKDLPKVYHEHVAAYGGYIAKVMDSLPG
jgi:asparagine synthase (glutamine-hydrolysing)